MKKFLCVLFTAIFVALCFTVTIFAEVDTAPTITATGVSIRIPEGETKGGLRFKMTVDTPFPEGIEVKEQGTLIVPFYVIGENDLNLDTTSALKVVKTENKYYSYEDNYYEFTAVLTGIPVYNLKSTICARGYITYTLNGGEEQTVYSNTVIYDIYSIAEKMMASQNEKEENKVAVDEFIIDAYNEYTSVDGGNQDGLLDIMSPSDGETVYPYADQAKNYLLAGEALEGDINLETGNYVKIGDYHTQYVFDICKPIEITWVNAYENVASFTVMYATKADFSDAKYTYASGSVNTVQLYNLYKASDYYIKVIANLKDGTTRSTTSTFKTADLGPRVIHLDGSYNARDMGGYMTSSGKRTLQGLLYRSGQLDDIYWNGSANYSTELTAYGKYTAQKELGIKVDFDFRGSAYPAAIPGSTHVFVGVGGYNLASATNKENIRKTFSIFSNINNYPMVFHCQGGADRTGTIAYLFNALLGVSELDVVRDYEFTTFSIYSRRAIDSTSYIAKEDYQFYTTLNAQEGDTLQERVENYLLGVGVTEQEIANIKSIMFTGTVERSVTLPTELKVSDTPELNIVINGDLDDIEAIYVGGQSVDWYEIAGGVAVSTADFPESVTDGDVTVKIVFSDGEEIEGTFNYDSTRSITACDIVSKTFGLPLTVTLGALPEDVSAVYIDGQSVAYKIDGKVLTVLLSNMPQGLVSGDVTVKVVFTDGKELEDTFAYDSSDVVFIEDYMALTTLDSTQDSVSSLPVGYGKWVRMRLDATHGAAGDMRIFIGSYGIKLRGGSTRYHTLNTSGSIGLDARPGHSGITQTTFSGGNNLYLYMKVDLSDDAFTVSLVTTDRTTGEIKKNQSYTSTRLTSGEFTDANATVTFMIAPADTTKLTIYGGEAITSSAVFPESVSHSDESMDIEVSASYTAVSKVFISDTSVPFTVTSTGVNILVSDFPKGLNGTVTAKVVLSNGEELEGSFNYDEDYDPSDASTDVNASDYIDFGDASSLTILPGDENIVSSPIGYDKWIKIHCNNTFVSGGGDNHIYVGSYGVRLRGGFRIHTYNSEGKSVEVIRQPGISTSNYHFMKNFDVYMKVELVSDTEAKLYFKVCSTGTDNIVIPEESYTITRISNEIASENACVTFMLGSSAASGDSITIYKD